MNYTDTKDIRATWKGLVRKHPILTRMLQSIFDPAFAQHSARSRIIKELPSRARILNLGSGVNNLNRWCVNMDIELFGNVNVVGDGQQLPFKDETFDMVLLEYVTEHVPDSTKMRTEIWRVLKRGGIVYATVPFIQAYHGNPDDFYRFTVSGFTQYWRDFQQIECAPFGGPASALVGVVKEFLAILH